METIEKLQHLLKPASIAVIGASESEGSVGKALLSNIVSSGYTGKIYPVNPKYAGQEVIYHSNGTKKPLTYLATPEELPDSDVDLALIMTPSKTVPHILDILGQKHLPSVVVISAGFKELGEQGNTLAEQVTQTVEKYDMVLVGPNCLGIADTDPTIRLNATFAKQAPPIGKGAVFSQSGAVGIDIIDKAKRMGLGLTQFVSLGNELHLRPKQLLQFWHHDPQVAYIAGYMESGRSLAEIKDTAAEVTKEKPVLLIKAGKSSIGAQAAKSHTGSLAGNDDAVNALCAQTGIQRFGTITDLFAAAQAFENAKPSAGNRVAIFSNAGGYAVMGSDRLEPAFHQNQGLVLAQFSEDTYQQLEKLLPRTASKKNPVDTTATMPMDSLENYKQALLAILKDPQVDSCIVPIIPLLNMQLHEITNAIAAVQNESEKPLLVVLSTHESDIAQIHQELKTAKLSPLALYASMEEAITGLGALEKHRLWQMRPKAQPIAMKDVSTERVQRIFHQVKQEERILLTTSESLDVLCLYGIESAPFKVVTTLEEALEAAQVLNYPLALKLNSKTITHKTDIGGVQVDIRNDAELTSRFLSMREQLSHHGVTHFEPGEGIMIQAYLTRGREIILGIKDDPDFGKLLMIGRGGIYTTIDQDVQFRLAPLTRQDAQEMIEGIKAYQILKGYRGKPAVDLNRLEEAMIRLSCLAMDCPEIQELDINPYMATPEGEVGNSSVDARIILKSHL